MLRRYSSRGVDTVALDSRRTIGRNHCDINIEGPGVCSPHAAFEFNPLSRSYWLRDLSLTESTTVNGRPVDGQVELHNGDLIRLGDAQPLVFAVDSLLPMRKNDFKTNSRSYDQAVQLGGMLPVLGQKLEPQQSAWRPLNGSRTGSTSTTKKSRLKRAENGKNSGFRERRINEATSPFADESKSSGCSIDSNSEISPRATGVSGSIASVGNSLLQRVVRLQAEVSRKDEEIIVLIHRLRVSEEQLSSLRSGRRYSFLQDVPKHKTSIASSISPLNFELEAYRSFVRIIAAKLGSFNDRALRQPHKDYADVFLNFSRELEEPFGNKMAEIEDECRSELHNKGFDDLQLARLRAFLADDVKEHVSSLAGELEVIFPVLRDATSIAKESIKACTVFTQWSRHLGDSLRSGGLKSSLLNHAIDCLKEQFHVSEMNRHWLPPSIAPLLRLIALDAEHRETKREKETQTDVLEEENAHEIQNEEEEHFTVTHAAVENSTPNDSYNLDSLIQQAEEKTLQLQKEIDVLSESIKQTLDLDKETEEHLEELFAIMAATGDSMHKFTLQNGRKTSRDSIFSVEVRKSDLDEGMLLYRDDSFKLESPDESSDDNFLRRKRSNLSRHQSDRISIIEEEPEEITDADNHTETLEAFRARLLSQLETEPSAMSSTKVLVRKDLLMDIIFAAQLLSSQLKTADKKDEISKEEHAEAEPEDGEGGENQPHSEEGTEDTEDMVTKVEVPVLNAAPEEQNHSEEEEILPENNDEQESRVEEEGTSETNQEEENIVNEENKDGESEGEEEGQDAEMELQNIGETEQIEASEEAGPETEHHEKGEEEEHLENQATENSHNEDEGEVDKSFDGESEACENEEHEEGGEENAMSDNEEEIRKEEEQSPTKLPKPPLAWTISVDEPEKNETTAEPQTLLPLLESENQPEQRLATATGLGAERIPRPRSARPRTSIDIPRQSNGNVMTGMAALKRTGGVEQLTGEGGEKKTEVMKMDSKEDGWSEDGTAEELSLSTAEAASASSPLPTAEEGNRAVAKVEVIDPKEQRLIEARRIASNGLADQILNSAKPKSICEISHSAHIQSHINTASKYPVSYQKVPVSSFDFFSSPPTQKKKRSKATDKPPLRQPRMQFKL